MRSPRFLLALVSPLVACAGLWACVADSPATGGGTTTLSTGGAGGTGGTGTAGSTGTGTPTPPVVACTLDKGADPVGFCTQKLVLAAEHQTAFDAQRGVAESWDSTTKALDQDASHAVLHDPLDDAAFCAAAARYAHSALIYGDTELTFTMQSDLVKLAPLLMTELSPPPAGYSGDLYFDLRAAASGLRLLNRNDLGDAVDAIADAYGRAIHDTYFVSSDGVLGAPAAGGGTAYAPGDVATGALALMDLAVRHATSEPAHATAWQDAAAQALGHLDARARDKQTGLFFAALVTSADPDHDALAPASPPSPPADALLTDVAARVTLALTRAAALVTANAKTLPTLVPIPLEARAEAILAALDATPKSLWDASGGPSDGDGGTLGSGYFTGWLPSTSELLTDKPTRANALLMGAIHRATMQGTPSIGARVQALRTLFADTKHVESSLISVVANQNGYFRQVPSGFNFAGADAGPDGRAKSYFSRSNAVAVEGLSELWVGLPY